MRVASTLPDPTALLVIDEAVCIKSGERTIVSVSIQATWSQRVGFETRRGPLKINSLQVS